MEFLTKTSLEKFVVRGKKPEDKKPSLAVHPVFGSLTFGHLSIGSMVKRFHFTDVKIKSRTKERASVSPLVSLLGRIRAYLRGGK